MNFRHIEAALPILALCTSIDVIAQQSDLFSQCLESRRHEVEAKCLADGKCAEINGISSCTSCTNQALQDQNGWINQLCKGLAVNPVDINAKEKHELKTDDLKPKPQISPTNLVQPQSVPQNTPATPSTNSVSKTPASKTVTAAKQSAQRTTPTTPDAASPEASSDISLCQNAYSTAQQCCNHPANCLQGSQLQQYQNDQSLISTPQPASTSSSNTQNSQGGGISGKCQQMQAAGNASRDANNLLASACNDKQSACQTACAQLITKYQTLLNNCNGCDSQNIYQSALTRLNGNQQTCSGLSAQLDTITSGSIASNFGADSGSDCMQQASNGGMGAASPQSAGDQKGNTTSNSQNAATTAATAAAQTAKPQGSGGFVTAAAKNNKFNLGDNADQAHLAPPTTGGDPGKPPTVGQVANNSGGGIPGQGGGGGGNAGGGGARGGGGAGAPGYTTNIEQGFRSGGGYSNPGGGGSDGSGGGGFEAASAPNQETINLRSYLPGGSREPAAVGGLTAMQAQSIGIYGPHVDIWQKVSDRLQAKCRLGELYDCR